MRVIGIIGVGHSGTTVLSFMLGSLPGCKTVGEGWHVMEREEECRCCALGKCPVFVEGYREGIEYDNAWSRLAEMLGTETLVVSDKFPFLYQRHTKNNPDIDLSFVLLYKRPEHFVFSSMRHNRTDNRISGLQHWTIANRAALRYVQKHDYRYTACSFEDLTAAPQDELARICQALDLTYDASAVEYWNHEHHQFGGSWAAHLNIWGADDHRSKRHTAKLNKGWSHYRDRFRQIIPVADVPLPFTPAELGAIYDYPDTRDVYDLLCAEGMNAD